MQALADFKDGKVQVLVATDIAARGIDITELPQVVNYELPHVPEDYVHRIGRTGRAGSAGRALSLVSTDERERLRAIEKLLGRRIDVLPLDRSGVQLPAQEPRPTQPRQAARAPQPRHASGPTGREGGRPAHTHAQGRHRNGGRGRR